MKTIQDLQERRDQIKFCVFVETISITCMSGVNYFTLINTFNHVG